MAPEALLIGAIGAFLGVIAGRRWLQMTSARADYKGKVAEVPKAKAAMKAARTAWLLATRAAMLAAVLLVVYFVATTTSVFQSAR